MEESVEIKEAVVAATEEPAKENLVQTPETSESSNGAASPPPNCSICLGKLKNTSFTDSCLHQFCFTCLLQWSKIKTECPLCKQTFKSIIHNVRSEEDYDQYHVPRDLTQQLPASQISASLDVGFELVGGIADVAMQRFVYRTTMTPNRRYNILLNPDQVARREQIPNMMPPSVSREERRYRRMNPTRYRRNVYQHGEWSNLMPDVYGRFRECSAEYYRRNPNQLSRLIPWINRELETLFSINESHIAYFLSVITDTLVRYDIRSAEFRNTIRPYFASYTDHFAHELLNYARTSFDLVGYDQYVTYPSHARGFSGGYIGRVVSPVSSTSSTSSDDSDVRVLDQTIDVSRVDGEEPSVGPHVIDMPGPSSVGEAFQVPQMGSGRPDLLTISSTCSSSDDCEVVGYVKPRHERTPEIIHLLSSDEVEETTNNREADCRTPVPRQEEQERPGPSGENRRCAARTSGSRRAARSHRWSTTSGGTSSSDSDVNYSPNGSRRHRRRSCRNKSHKRKVQRSRARGVREGRTGGSSECQSSPRIRMRRKRASNSSTSMDNNQRHNLRKSVRERAQTLRQLVGLVSGRRRSSSSSSSTSSSSTSSTSSCSSSNGSEKRKIRAILDKKSSVSSESGRLRSSVSVYEIVTDSVKVPSSRADHRQPVNATILRKNAANPDEWYVKNKKGSRGTSRSRSSSSVSWSSTSDFAHRSNSQCSAISGRTRAKELTKSRDGPRKRKMRSEMSENSDSEGSRRENATEASAVRRTKRRDDDIQVDENAAAQESRTDHDRKSARKSGETKRNDRDRSKEKSSRIDRGRKRDAKSKSNDRGKRKASQQSSKSSSGSRKKERARNNLLASTSKHSDNERRSISKDKHKRKKKPKTKRRRSRSESKVESRNSRPRMARSSSYSAPTNNDADL